MPTYEYKCRSCGHRFEEFHKISDPPIEMCPDCGEPAAERQISTGGGIVFKGSGFYATDYRKDPGPKGGEGGDSKSSGGSGSSGSEGSDSKSESSSSSTEDSA